MVYDFDVPAPQPPSGQRGRANLIRKIPKGASVFIAYRHSSNVVAADVSRLRKHEKLNLTVRRATENGVEGFRVWHLKDDA